MTKPVQALVAMDRIQDLRGGRAFEGAWETGWLEEPLCSHERGMATCCHGDGKLEAFHRALVAPEPKTSAGVEGGYAPLPGCSQAGHTGWGQHQTDLCIPPNRQLQTLAGKQGGLCPEWRDDILPKVLTVTRLYILPSREPCPVGKQRVSWFCPFLDVALWADLSSSQSYFLLQEMGKITWVQEWVGGVL